MGSFQAAAMRGRDPPRPPRPRSSAASRPAALTEAIIVIAIIIHGSIISIIATISIAFYISRLASTYNLDQLVPDFAYSGARGQLQRPDPKRTQSSSIGQPSRMRASRPASK